MILHGDSLQRLKEFPENYFDCIVTDPPYGLSFMGKKWDYDVPSVELWREVLRVLKPGGHVLSFGGTRTYHRMVVNIEDAGFEIRDCVFWHFGSGFPKSLNVYKAAQKAGLVCECDVNSVYEKNGCAVRGVQSADSETELLAQESQDADLQLRMQRSASRQGLGETRPQGCESQKEILAHVRVEKSSMEGRSNLQAEQGQLHRAEVRSVSEGVSANGSQGRLRDGTSSCDGDASGAELDSHRSGSSQRSQHEEQSVKKSRAIPEQSRTQTCGSCGKAIVDKGLGTALKPATEPIVLARKPLEKGLTVAENVLKYGTGALNIDGTRIGYASEADKKLGQSARSSKSKGMEFFTEGEHDQFDRSDRSAIQGRWPANVLFDEHAAAVLDEQSGNRKGFSGGGTRGAGYRTEYVNGEQKNKNLPAQYFNDSGGASRFFYVAKASKRERNAGLEGMPERVRNITQGHGRGAINTSKGDGTGIRENKPCANVHPTVKPIKLMEYLIKLVCPPSGIVLDPFCGSGSTGVASKKLERGFVGIELSAEYAEIASKRLEAV